MTPRAEFDEAVTRMVRQMDPLQTRLFVAAVKMLQKDLDEGKSFGCRLLLQWRDAGPVEVMELSWEDGLGFGHMLAKLPDVVPTRDLEGLALMFPFVADQTQLASIEIACRGGDVHLVLDEKGAQLGAPKIAEPTMPRYLDAMPRLRARVASA